MAFLDPTDSTDDFELMYSDYKTMLSTYVNFNLEVMQFEEFEDFTSYKDSIDTKPICTYT